MKHIESFLDALKIYTNPKDLCFALIEVGDGVRFFTFNISMGHEHNYNPVFKPEKTFGNRDDALNALRFELESVISALSFVVLKTGSPFRELLISEGKIDERKVLSGTRVEKIIKGLAFSNEFITRLAGEDF